jgi:hypothetical protein
MEESKKKILRPVTFEEEEIRGLKDMANIMDGDRACDSNYTWKSIENSDSGYGGDYPES